MEAEVVQMRDGGLSPFNVMLRLVATVDRLHSLADQAEARGRIADATRATTSEAKMLGLLLSLGVRGDREVNAAKDAEGLERAVAELVRETPTAGDFVVRELEAAGRSSMADLVHVYTERCKAVSEGER